jgi:hypothetical protein
MFGLLTDDDIQSLKAEGYDDDYLDPSDLAVEALEYYNKNRVYWINWPSFSSKHKKPQNMREDNCRVVVKGQTATVFLKDGILKKRLSTNGFIFIPRK